MKCSTLNDKLANSQSLFAYLVELGLLKGSMICSECGRAMKLEETRDNDMACVGNASCTGATKGQKQ